MYKRSWILIFIIYFLVVLPSFSLTKAQESPTVTPTSTTTPTSSPTQTPTVTNTPTTTLTPTLTPTSTPTSGCTDPAPGSTAHLDTAESTGPHSIKLSWTAAKNPVTSYLLAYGIESGKYIYGNPNMGGSGITTYTVGGLATGKKYYFVIRAVNGCNSTEYSNEVSATAGGTNASPSPLQSVTPKRTPTEEEESTLETSSEEPTETPAPTEIIAAPKEGNSSILISQIVLGGTILGFILAVVGGVLYFRMKKKSVPLIDTPNQF